MSTGVNATVSYKHTSADNTFEIDMTDPSASIQYAGLAIEDDDKIANRSPFIKVVFDDGLEVDGYRGDSYTDVNLTAATLTMGDG